MSNDIRLDHGGIVQSRVTVDELIAAAALDEPVLPLRPDRAFPDDQASGIGRLRAAMEAGAETR